MILSLINYDEVAAELEESGYKLHAVDDLWLMFIRLLKKEGLKYDHSTTSKYFWEFVDVLLELGFISKSHIAYKNECLSRKC
jgi:hypothetical protein